MLSQADLAQFTGSESFYRHNLVRAVVYTEGVQYLADKAGAYWLVDKIATEQLRRRIHQEEFQAWKLVVNADKSATLTMEDGNGKSLTQEKIDWTDFPLPEITLWFTNNTILLPSEY